jgi:HSP20 family protein
MASTIAKAKKVNDVVGKQESLDAMRDIPSIMRRMQTEFDQLFNHFARSVPMPIENLGRHGSWGLDVDDREDCIVLRVDAPGFETGDFDLRVSGDRLVLRASRKSEAKGEEGESLEERRCYESMTLPPGVDTTKIEAKYLQDILMVTIPKTAEGRGKKIEIKNS